MAQGGVLLIDPGLKFIFNRRGLHADRYFPRGLLSVGSFLQARGVPVEVFAVDSFVDEQINLLHPTDGMLRNLENVARRLAEHLAALRPAVVGVGCIFTMQYPLSLRLLEMVKALAPRAVTAIGGYHVSFRDLPTFQESPAVDVVVRGEGEWTALELYQAVRQGRDYTGLAGATVRQAAGPPRRNPPRALGDLAEVPPIDYGLLPAEYARDTGINLVVSRGCAFRCSYCVEPQFFERKVRRFPFPTVMEEIRRLHRRWPGIQFNLEDSMFYIKSRHFLEFCQELQAIRTPDMRIGYINSRVDTVSEEGLAAARAAGISGVIYGVESASPKVMALMQKHIDTDKAVAACRLARSQGLTTGTYWLFGHPGDSPEEAELTLQALERFYREGLHDAATLSMFVPYPGTPFFEQPERWGMRILSYDWEAWGRFNEERICELEGFPRDEIYACYRRGCEIRHRWQILPALKAWLDDHSEDLQGVRLVSGQALLGGVSLTPQHLVDLLQQMDDQLFPRWIGVLYSGRSLGVRLSPSLSREGFSVEDLARLLTERLGGRFRAGDGVAWGVGLEVGERPEEEVRAEIRAVLEPLLPRSAPGLP